MKKLVINMTNLPDDVKLVQLQRQKKERITKSNINKSPNDLTVKLGDVTNTQVELNFIQQPVTKVNFLIYKDGIFFSNLTGTIKNLRKKFCKLLM